MRKSSVKRFAALVMALLLVLTASSFALASGSAEKVTLNIASVYTMDHPFGPAIDQILTKFEQDNPNVTIKRQFQPGEEMSKKLAIQLASDTMPEIFVVYPGAGDVGKFAPAAMDLTEALNADMAWKDGFISGALDNYKVEGMPGMYAAPVGTFCVGFYYNKAIFEKVGVQPPQTWAQLLEVIGKLKEAGYTPWALGAKDTWRDEHLASNIFYKLNGVAAASDLGSRKLAYDSPEYIGMYQKLVELNDAGAFGKNFAGMDYAGEIAEFNNGKAAMRMSGSWSVGETTGKDAPADIKENVGFFPFPYFEDKEMFKDDWMGGTSDAFAISAKASDAQKEMAIKLVKVLTSSESAKLISESAHDLTAIKSDLDPAKAGALLTEVSKAMSTGKAFGGDFVGSEKNLTVNKEAYNLCQAVLLKMVSPEDAAKKILDEIKKTDGQ